MAQIDLLQFRQLEEQGLINCQKHPTADLLIWNYSKKCQFEKVWTEETMMARGLITDSAGNIKARPFKKFFNFGEQPIEKLPDGLPMWFEKIDGSLGILYWLDGKPLLATRGSFVSEQAVRGNEILNKFLAENPTEFREGYTYLFEIIYPENRIVVDYHSDSRLILLGIINIETGEEINLFDDTTPFAAASYHGMFDLSQQALIKNTLTDNREGLVLKWTNGFRLKIKFDEYVRLHRLLTGITARKIWELMSNGDSLKPLYESVPEEFALWVKETVKKLQGQYQEIYAYCKARADKARAEVKVEGIIDGSKSLDWNELERMARAYRKAVREFFITEKSELEAINWEFFNKNREVGKEIWAMLKPEHEIPFKKDVDA